MAAAGEENDLMTTIPGYDDWKMTPPDADGLQCDWCGAGSEIRVESEGDGWKTKPSLTCEECFTGTDDGPCFDDLETAEEYFGEQEAERGDYLLEQRRDMKMEG